MSLKITCSKCKSPHVLREPLPLPGSQVHCSTCGLKMTMTYPVGLLDKLRSRGIKFQDSELVDAPAASVISPNKEIASQKKSPSSSPKKRQPNPSSEKEAPQIQKKSKTKAKKRTSETDEERPRTKKTTKFSWLRLFASITLFGIIGGGVAGLGVYQHYANLVPSVDELKTYSPPTVTTLYDRNGELLGEIYEKRRYVRKYEQFPEHLVNSFLAAEDANFWKHHGIDYFGILRAVIRNALKGKKAQGASTITQQVAKNFLLSSEKTYTRKIKEAIIAQRIEEAFDKKHILFLYLNEIYLGSGAYGVEAAARVYFNKHVEELTLAESAIIAGLPQRPSDYSPHQHWKKARARQEYVLGQLLQKKFINQAAYDIAIEEKVRVYEEDNEFLKQAPHYTEHVRRYLVETYGFNKIYNDGLDVITACDLELQKIGQAAVYEKVAKAARSQGWEGPIKTIPADQIDAYRQKKEEILLESSRPTGLIITEQTDPAGGPFPKPKKSALKERMIYEAVVLEVTKKHAFIGIGSHKAIIPLSWSKWGYEPNFERSFKSRSLSDLNKMLKKGDIILARIETLDANSEKNLKGYKPIKDITIPAAQVWKEPDLEGALFSYRLTDSSPGADDQGAVITMVGGYDFEKSEYNRATQAQRQVGSTFKPLVYSTAIKTRKFTVASQVLDGPIVFQTFGNKLWKPGNYGNNYLGKITLRQALQKSRNTCTIRILDKVSLEDVFQTAGPQLRIGYDQAVMSRKHLPLKDACEGESTPSPVKGMQWCETKDPTTCPLVNTEQQYFKSNGQDVTFDSQRTCIDDSISIDGEDWCHSCDVNLRVCDWLPIVDIPEDEPCVDARQTTKGIMCRSCDLSMGLGSSSLTMVELVQAYSVFASYGKLIEPYYIESVKDRDGTIIESHIPVAPKEVMNPSVAGIATWLLEQVATGGTAAQTNKLKLHVAGKTGTTNDFFDAWFVGFNPDILAASWVGYDIPKSMGQSFTGGDIALPIWMDFMREAVPESKDRRFPPIPQVNWVTINEETGLLATDGRPVPMLPGTAPTNIMGSSDQKTVEDLIGDDF